METPSSWRRAWVHIGNPGLGLVQGHYEIGKDVEFLGDMLGSGKVPVNTGMAIVIPAQKILDMLLLPQLAEHRKSTDMSR